MRLLSYNIRKGKGGWRSPRPADKLSSALQERAPDVVMLQEVFHDARADGPQQACDLASELEFASAYGANARYSRGHHGNATLARFEIIDSLNHDLSTNPIERRGVLWVRARIGDREIDLYNTHLGLNRRQRQKQIDRIADVVEQHTNGNRPYILAGDFNDWTGRLDLRIRDRLGVESSLVRLDRKSRASFPNLAPILALDRIYWHGLDIRSMSVLRGEPWRRLSDHLPLEAEIEL